MAATHHYATMYKITEDQEALEVIARLDERINVEQTNVDGRRKTIIHKAYCAGHLFAIEQFVKAVEEGWQGGFVEEVTCYAQVTKIRKLFLGKRYYRLVNSWLQQYSDIHRYSARVELFYDVCKEFGLLGERRFWFGKPGEIASANGTRYMHVFNALIDAIRDRSKTREFKERERLRLTNAERNRQNVLAMEEAMFSVETGKSRWLVLSLTLAYHHEHRGRVTLEMIQQHRDRFFAARRFNKLMSGIGNYVWAIEQGEDTGLHLHVILFYSAEHNRDEFIAQQICQYWNNVVTEDKGESWSSNEGWLKRRYDKHGHGVGVGQINWNDAVKREALRTNLMYLAKAEQYLMIKGAESAHTFGMGQVPKRVKTGRPRVEAGSENEIGSSIDAELVEAKDTKRHLSTK